MRSSLKNTLRLNYYTLIVLLYCCVGVCLIRSLWLEKLRDNKVI